MSKKSWGDGTGGGPEKEEKDAKQEHFHSLTCEKWADSKKISNKEVSVLKMLLKCFLTVTLPASRMIMICF